MRIWTDFEPYGNIYVPRESVILDDNELNLMSLEAHEFGEGQRFEGCDCEGTLPIYENDLLNLALWERNEVKPLDYFHPECWTGGNIPG